MVRANARTLPGTSADSWTSAITLSVATKESWKDENNEWQSRTEWHRVVAFGKLAESVKALAKGSHVSVQGSLRFREYEANGVKHQIAELRADTIGKLDRADRAAAVPAPTA
jgi:single-strand DNA-binding protein